MKAGELTAIDLRQIPIPAGGNVKVYRDLNALTEELKQYFSTYVLGGNVFSLAEYPFGDLYIKSFGMRDGSVPLNYNICAAATRPKMTTKGDRLCKAYNMGTFMMMTEMFSFASNGSYTQWEVGPQGKPYAYPLGRLLVAKQTTSAVASFVNVLPGQYVVEMTDAKGVVKAVPMNAGAPTSTSQMNVGWIPAGAQLKMNGDSSIAVPASIDPSADPNEPSADALASADDGGDDYVDTSMTCSSARQWRTDLRAYCTSDSTPGCARSSAKVCEPMFDTP